MAQTLVPHFINDKGVDRIAIGATAPELVAECGPHGVTVNPLHPLCAALLAAERPDPVLVAWLASSVYTAMNSFWAEIHDDHEIAFHDALLADVLALVQAR